MSLIGECDDCGEHAQLHYKPCVPDDEQTRPSVCNHCRDRREEMAEEHARSMGVYR